MIRPTRNQWIFAAIFAGYTILFHHFLNRTIEAQQYERIWMLATGYGVLTFFTALILGAFDPVRRSRGVLAFQYNLTTFVVSVVIWLVWNAAGGCGGGRNVPGVSAWDGFLGPGCVRALRFKQVAGEGDSQKGNVRMTR